jgi:hypothetical protein
MPDDAGVASFGCDIGEVQEDADDTGLGLIESCVLKIFCEEKTAPVQYPAAHRKVNLYHLATALKLWTRLAQPPSRQPHIPCHTPMLPSLGDSAVEQRHLDLPSQP